MRYGDQVVTIDRFLGLNEDIAGDTQLRMGESPDMTNFRVTELGKLMKRDGYTTFVTDNINNTTIQTMWYGEVSGTNTFLFVTNGKIYKVTDMSSGTFTQVGTLTVTNNPPTIFSYAGKAYVINGVDYKSWSGTGSFDNVDPYVPLVFTATYPNGTGANSYETMNLLTNKKHQQFNGDGTATVYQLAEKSVVSIDQVKVNGIVQTLTTDYTVNPTNGTVTFVAAPSDGTNNVDIYWTKGADNSGIIKAQKYACIFGKGSNARVFLYGNATNKQRFYYCAKRVDTGVVSPEYFPSPNYVDVGDIKSPITGMISQYDRLIIFKSDESHFATMSFSNDYTTKSGDSLLTIDVNKLNDTIGNVAVNQQQLIENSPFTVFKGIYHFTNTNVKDERNAKYMSKRVNRTLESADLSSALTIDFEYLKEYWICIGTMVWIYNYAFDVWYKFSLYNAPKSFIVIDKTVYFGTNSGKIYKFVEGSTLDGSINIASHWESGFMDFGSSWQTKFLNRMWLSNKPGEASDIDISWQTDENAAISVANVTANDTLNFGNVDFGSFYFNTSANPKPHLLRIKAKKFSYFKLLIDSQFSHCTILALNFSIQKGGVVK